MKKSFPQIILTLLIVTLLPSVASAQQKFEFKSDKPMFMVRETGALLVQEKDKLKIEMVLSPEQRPKGYADVDMKKDDMISMMNGKRVKTTDEAKTIYDGLKAGEDVKFGIMRGEQMLITSFKKADEKDLPQIKQMIVKGDGGDIKPLPELGMILGFKNKKIEILDMMENADEVLKKHELTEGDQLVSLNGSSFNSLKEFSTAYDKINIGDKVDLKFSGSGKIKSIMVKKPEAKGNVIIKKGNN